MITVAKRISQATMHMSIAYMLAYAMTGSAMSSGLAVLAEPVINVALLPFHERAWTRLRRSARGIRADYLAIVAEKISQTGLHAGVAFGVMYLATGSAAVGGLAALLEPVCNVLLLPVHDRMWEKVERFSSSAPQLRGT